MSETETKFNQVLKVHIKANFPSQGVFAEQAGLSPSMVSAIVTGKAPYTIRRHETYMKVLGAMGIPDEEKEAKIAGYFPESYKPRAFVLGEAVRRAPGVYLTIGQRIDAIISDSGLSRDNQQLLSENLISTTLLFTKALGHRQAKRK